MQIRQLEKCHPYCPHLPSFASCSAATTVDSLWPLPWPCHRACVSFAMFRRLIFISISILSLFVTFATIAMVFVFVLLVLFLLVLVLLVILVLVFLLFFILLLFLFRFLVILLVLLVLVLVLLFLFFLICGLGFLDLNWNIFVLLLGWNIFVLLLLLGWNIFVLLLGWNILVLVLLLFRYIMPARHPVFPQTLFECLPDWRNGIIICICFFAPISCRTLCTDGLRFFWLICLIIPVFGILVWFTAFLQLGVGDCSVLCPHPGLCPEWLRLCLCFQPHLSEQSD